MPRLRRIGALTPRTHACLVYDDDAWREQAATDFLLAGLERGEKVVYLAPDGETAIAEAVARNAASEISAPASGHRGRRNTGGRQPCEPLPKAAR